MAKPGSSFDETTPETIFLDVHVESIQEDFTVGASYPLRERDSFRGSVHHELFEAIDHFNAKDHLAVFGGFDRFANTFHRTISQHSFIFAGRQFSRPGAVINSSHDGSTQIFHGTRDVLEKGYTIFADRSVLRGQIHVVFQADAVGQAETCLFRRAFKHVPLFITHASDLWSVDLKDVEAPLVGSS